ncbi:MAG: TIGR03960 family B12-binding radical SAM protein [bacterium]|nr:TIGR03960 family B12-binding radical SAM protein [bacterium]
MTPDLVCLEKHFLPFVEKPSRYLGGEPGLSRLPENPTLRVALAFPDLYELGMSYLGLRILLHLANEIESVACERVFMPWFDAVIRLKAENLPLFTLETRTPLKNLDLIGINIQYELHSTNILGLLDLAGIPLFAADRTESDPIILGGGPLAYHPEPFAPFFDAIAVGDGEELFPEALTVLAAEKRKGTTRFGMIRALGDIQGIYLPSYYEPQYSKTGEYQSLRRLDDGLPKIILSRITNPLQAQYYPIQPIVPTLEATHNRLVVEIARGCSRGCRFCAPGMNNRPVRERPISDLLKEADAGLSATGYNELSLLSLSIADYSCLSELLESLEPILSHHRASLSFPSLRPDKFTPQMADRAASGSRTGLTFAPEAASQLLRGGINKDTSDEALLNAAELAFERGWKSLKLYFMIGLPGETEVDLHAMIDLINKVNIVGRKHQGGQINVSVSPFSPKPHTPFEREGQLPIQELRSRLDLLRRSLHRHRNVKLEVRGPEISRIETAIARSDRRGGQAILNSYRAGGLFDAWSNGFSADRWEKSFGEAELSLDRLTGMYSQTQPLPWEHITNGIDSEFYNSEQQAAARSEMTPDCRSEGCQFCGLQTRHDVPCPESPVTSKIALPTIRSTSHQSESCQRYRLRYQRSDEARYHAHLATLGVFERALRRLQMPLEFTQGYKPHLKLSASPPLALGMTSQSEYLDFGLWENWSDGLLDSLQKGLPAGYRALHVREILRGQPNIGALNIFQYRVVSRLLPDGAFLKAGINTLLLADSLPVQRVGPGKIRSFDARPSIWMLAYVEGDLVIGIKNHGGPTPRVEDVLKLLLAGSANQPDLSPAGLLADWDVERQGMWWDIAGIHQSPDQLIYQEITVNSEPSKYES